MTAKIIRLTVTLEDTNPPIWRRVDVAADTTLRHLHEIIQSVMGWDNTHLHEFEIGGELLEGPGIGGDPVAGNIRTACLADLMQQNRYEFRYIYDMGDNWGHTLQMEWATAVDLIPRYPHFIDGKGRCPPEDVGGTFGFDSFLNVMRNCRHPEYRELALWHGGAFDPDNIDTGRIRHRLKELAVRPGPARRPR